MLQQIRSLTSSQRNAVIASFLGWTLDAFDFFIVVFVLNNIAQDFGTTVTHVAFALTLTLAMRPLGAFIFGWMADRYGRRPVLMIDIALFSVLELASAFAPNLTVFFILRALFGVAMGGEWGVGSSLVMEAIPSNMRGLVSGFLQQGYAFGYLFASLLYWLAAPYIGWRGMFIVGVLPTFLVIYVRQKVEESPVWSQQTHQASGMLKSIAVNWKLFLYVILLMSCFTAFSHGTQDLYPTFLKAQKHFDGYYVSLLTCIGALGAIVGGNIFGVLSEHIGRRRAIIIAACLALPVIYLWIYADSIRGLACGVFLMQFAVQGAWGVVPAHLNELSPEAIRGTFPGFTYQLGNFLIALMAPYQAMLAENRGGDYGFALAATTGVVALLMVVTVALGKERKGVVFGR